MEEKKASKFSELNHVQSEAVENFLDKIGEEALALIASGEIIIVDKTFLEGYRISFERFMKNNDQLKAALETVKQDRDILLEATHQLWHNMGFVIEAMNNNEGKNSGKAKALSALLKLVGFREIDKDIVHKVLAILVALKDNKALVEEQNLKLLGEKLIPALEILARYHIIPESLIKKHSIKKIGDGPTE